METLVPQTQELGAINMVSIKSSALANASTHARFFFFSPMSVILTDVFPLDYLLADC